jgi:hypothetical protein
LCDTKIAMHPEYWLENKCDFDSFAKHLKKKNWRLTLEECDDIVSLARLKFLRHIRKNEDLEIRNLVSYFILCLNSSLIDYKFKHKENKLQIVDLQAFVDVKVNQDELDKGEAHYHLTSDDWDQVLDKIELKSFFNSIPIERQAKIRRYILYKLDNQRYPMPRASANGAKKLLLKFWEKWQENSDRIDKKAS